MTLDDLVEWVDAAMARLPSGMVQRKRSKHARKLYRILDKEGCQWELREPWYVLALKVARLLNEPAPEKPSEQSPEQRTRTPWRPPEPPAPKKPKRAEKPPPIERWRDERPARRRLARPKPQPIEINAQLQAAFDAVAAGRQVIFVTGGAGTGKSTFIRELRARFSEKRSVVLAPTGVAALNAGGQTIHSFCRLPLRPVMPQDVREIEEKEVVEALDLLIIDEISMVRADVLDGVDAFLRINRKSELPFGG
ncbi:MAG TPA: AAA family ATPase, partial [Thermoanaerobaculia bacterium]|nr:AAA family ATPase [Thermoanaerobaculia bacterium]